MENQTNNQISEVTKTYPTTPDADGFYYEDEGEEALQIETKVYDNDNMIKRVKLSKGRVAIIRELIRKDGSAAQRMSDGGDGDLYQDAKMSLATKIDDKIIPMEDFATMKLKDYERLSVAFTKLNFI